MAASLTFNNARFRSWRVAVELVVADGPLSPAEGPDGALHGIADRYLDNFHRAAGSRYGRKRRAFEVCLRAVDAQEDYRGGEIGDDEEIASAVHPLARLVQIGDRAYPGEQVVGGGNRDFRDAAAKAPKPA